MAYDDEPLPRSPSSSVITDGHGRAFERARTTIELPDDLGDSERWGGSDEFDVLANSIVDSQQVVRVQMKQGRARQWSGFAQFTLLRAPVSPAFSAIMRLNLKFGTGQTHQFSSLFLFGNVNPANGVLTAVNPYGNTTLVAQSQASWFANFFGGGNFPIDDIPATHITAWFTVAFFTNVVNDSFRVSVSANMAPRAAS
jgi:hypothetical protein